MKSPFEYTSPEALTGEEIADLFVPVFGEYLNVPSVGHTFINGPRGSGKSMIFRYMSPDCQSLVEKKKIHELDYFGIHIPIKEGQLDKTDLSLLNGKHGEALLNEHFMVINFAIKIFESLASYSFEESKENNSELGVLYSSFLKLLNYSRWNREYEPLDSNIKCSDIFKRMQEICTEVNRDFNQTLIRSLFSAEGKNIQYQGPICLFMDFLFEILKNIQKLPFMPSGPIYLLVDDADNLTETQTKILNTWVSMRTSKTVSFKISTQLGYKTFKTVNNSRIDTPHDYSEINISDIYTSKKGLYKERVKEAVEKRLRRHSGDSDISAETFFPPNTKQDKEIAKLFEVYQTKHNYDFAYRYAKPDYMKSLKGNLNSYSYAGFENLVNISSGVMRHFIDFAHRMYTHQISRTKEKISYIDPSIQDAEIKEYSDWFFDENFSKLSEDSENTDDEISDFEKLRNLIEALGQTFHVILFSDAKERRVFSFALQNDPSEELKRVLRLGVQNGYFQKSLIGNKMGTGKAQLYILNRLLAPHFKLDPTSFAGYKFVTCDILQDAMRKPSTFIGRVKSRGVDTIFEDPQLSLFNES
jgi:hypothetical protein